MKRRVHLQVVAIAFVATVVFSLIGVQSQNTPQATVAIDPDDIGGVVTSSRGPEAGVWVIAETRDTPTRLVKSVVTDDRGRYLIPDLPKANYDVWIRNIVGTDGCTGCHQMGNRATREIPEALGTFPNSAAAWERRIQSGQAGNGMNSRFTQVGRPRAFKMFADWTDKIAHGTLPDA